MNFFRLVLAVFLLKSANLVTAKTVLIKLDLKSPQECKNLNCVRNNIDIIDAEVIELIGLRLKYVKRAGALKFKNKTPTHDQSREDEIMSKITRKAINIGYPESIAKEIYKTLLIQTNIFLQKQQEQLKIKGSDFVS